MTTKRFAPILFALALAASACGSSDDASPVTEAPTAATEPAATEPAATEPAATEPAATEPASGLALSSAALGDVLTDANGNTVYLFTPDAQGVPTCYDECAANWPAVAEMSGVGDGLDASLLGTADRDDGTTQATYNGWPLYTFAGDSGPGDTNGQAVGDVWFALDAGGNAVPA